MNGGTAALRAVRRRAQPMPSQLRFTLSISGSRGSSRNKNEKEWWSREVWPRRRRPLRTPARWSSRRSGQCGLTSARLRERDGRRGRGRRGGALGGLAWPETRWSGRESWPKHGVARRDRKRREWSALSKGRVRGVHAVRGDLWATLDLTGGAIDGVRPTGGWTRGGGQALSKLNHFMNRPIAVTVTLNSSMFYWRFTLWFWLGFVPLDRAT